MLNVLEFMQLPAKYATFYFYFYNSYSTATQFQNLVMKISVTSLHKFIILQLCNDVTA